MIDWLAAATPNSDPERDVDRDPYDIYRDTLDVAARRIGGEHLERECRIMLNEDGYSAAEVIDKLRSIDPDAMQTIIDTYDESIQAMYYDQYDDPPNRQTFARRMGSAVLSDLRLLRRRKGGN